MKVIDENYEDFWVAEDEIEKVDTSIDVPDVEPIDRN